MVQISLTVDGEQREDDVEPRLLLVHYLRERRRQGRNADRLRHQQLRRVHRASGRPEREVVQRARRAGRRQRDHDHRGPGQRRVASGADRVQGVPRPAVRLLHPGHDHGGGRPAQGEPDPTEDEIRDGLEGNLCRCTGYQNIVKSVQHAAAAEVRDDRHARAPRAAAERRRPAAAPQGGRAAGHRSHELDRQHRAARACCTWPSCAARWRTPGSPASTSRRR